MPKSTPGLPFGTPVTGHRQASAHTSITPGMPSQVKVTVKQQDAPSATPAAAATLIQPVQPGGTGFGAGVKSSLSSAALQPGHSPANAHVAPAGSLQKISVCTWLDPDPGRTK